MSFASELPPRHEGTHLLWLIGHAYRMSRRRTALIVRAHGVTMAQFSLLTTLADEPRLSGIDVAERTGVSPQAAHAALTGLERKGLVQRVAEVEHRRVVRTRLTKKGEQILTSCLDELRDLGVEFADRLAPRKRSALIELMTEYVEANRSDDA